MSQYRRQRVRVNLWTWTTAYSVAGWSAFMTEPGATTASFMDPATAPDIEVAESRLVQRGAKLQSRFRVVGQRTKCF